MVEGLRFRLSGQLTKALGDDFREISCWYFGQNVNGMEIVKKSGKI